MARRLVVDIAKCDVCHDVLSLHGNNRTDEPGVCAVCHNPNATDVNVLSATDTGQADPNHKPVRHWYQVKYEA